MNLNGRLAEAPAHLPLLFIFPHWRFSSFSLACDSLEVMNFACTIDISLCFGQLHSRERHNSTHPDKAPREYTGTIVVSLIKDYLRFPLVLSSRAFGGGVVPSLETEGHTGSLEAPRVFARGFKGQSLGSELL